MTLSPWLIYFAGIADNVSVAFQILTIFSFIAFGLIMLLSVIAGCAEEETAEKKLKPLRIPFFVFACIFLLIFVLTPSTNTIYKVMIIPTVVNSTVVQKLPGELQQFIDKELRIDKNKQDDK